MMELRLTRTDLTSDGVFGTLRVPGSHVPLATCEDDFDATVGASCIPAGTYVLKRTVFHKHNYEAFEVTNVPGRSRILIHIGNTEEDVEGCILVGLKQGMLTVARDEDTGLARTKRAVLGSKPAFKMFMSWMDGIQTATLVIEWAPGLLPQAEAA